jgi:hypothetical protein
VGLFSKNDTGVDNPYEGLRQQVLDSKPDENLKLLMEGRPIYAAIVDMDMGKAIATLACFIDGTTSLYFSNGGGELGLGQAHEEVRNATVAFLRSSEQILDNIEVANDFALPVEGKHSVYLISENIIYKYEIDLKTIESESKEINFLFFLYNNVLNKIRETKQEN